MVLDTRFLQPSDPDQEVATAPAVVAEDPVHRLEHLLEESVAASSPAARAAALDRLRVLVPSPAGLELLCRIAADAADHRRRPAVHTLGFHREWLGDGAMSRRLTGWIEQEEDIEVARAMVWCLRDTEAPARFLLHDHPDLALEAALGLRLGPPSLERVVEALRLGRAAAVERVLLQRLEGVQPHLAETLVEYLAAEPWERSDGTLERIVQGIPQVALFEGAIEAAQGQGWTPQQGLGGEASDAWPRRLADVAAAALKRAPESALLRYLLNRSGEDEAFARRYAPLFKEVLSSAETLPDDELLHYFERLTARASGDKVVRLAQMLVQLSARLEGPSEVQATALLEEWKDRFPHLRLKLFHLQQGWT